MGINLKITIIEIITLDFPFVSSGETAPDDATASLRRTVEVKHPSADQIDQAAVEIQDERMMVTVVGAEKPGVYALQLPSALSDNMSDLVVTQDDQASGVSFAVELVMD